MKNYQDVVDETKATVEHKIEEIYESDFPKDWRQLAEVDESQPYEVDRTAIFSTSEGEFILATASGCSCWSGEWQIERFKTLEEIENAWRTDREYGFSYRTAVTLLDEARKNLVQA